MASVHRHRNRWRVKWRDEHGRQLTESFATEAEASAAARTIEARTVIDGTPPTLLVDDNALTLARWWARWEPGRPWRESSRRTHAVHWRRYIEPVFGKVPLDEITTADVQRFHRVLERRGLAPNTVAAIHRTLSMALEGAELDGLLERNAARSARLPRAPKSPPVALDLTTTTAMLDAIAQTAPGLAPFAELIAATGLRRAEAAGLTWDRVNLDAGEIVIDRQLDYSAPTLPTWAPTKNAETRRVVLTAKTVEMLRTHRVAQPVTTIDRTGLVFTRPDGSAWARTTLADAWRRAARLMADQGTPLPAGARGWHTLRHGVASRLLEAGIPPVEAAQMMGHSPETLLATYAHVTDRDAADQRLRAALDN